MVVELVDTILYTISNASMRECVNNCDGNREGFLIQFKKTHIAGDITLATNQTRSSLEVNLGLDN